MFINCASSKESPLTNPNMVIPICNWGNPPLQLKGILGKVLLNYHVGVTYEYKN